MSRLDRAQDQLRVMIEEARKDANVSLQREATDALELLTKLGTDALALGSKDLREVMQGLDGGNLTAQQLKLKLKWRALWLRARAQSDALTLAVNAQITMLETARKVGHRAVQILLGVLTGVV